MTEIKLSRKSLFSVDNTDTFLLTSSIIESWTKIPSDLVIDDSIKQKIKCLLFLLNRLSVQFCVDWSCARLIPR